MTTPTHLEDLIHGLDEAAKRGLYPAPNLIPTSLEYLAARAIEEQAAEIEELKDITKGVDWTTWHDALEILCALESHQAKVAELQDPLSKGRIAYVYDLEAKVAELEGESTGRLERLHEFEFIETNLSQGSSRCPLCGRDHPHTHSPNEIVIYKNGQKHAQSDLTASRASEARMAGTLARILNGFTEHAIIGHECIRHGWERAELVAEWRETLADHDPSWLEDQKREAVEEAVAKILAYVDQNYVVNGDTEDLWLQIEECSNHGAIHGTNQFRIAAGLPPVDREEKGL